MTDQSNFLSLEPTIWEILIVTGIKIPLHVESILIASLQDSILGAELVFGAELTPTDQFKKKLNWGRQCSAVSDIICVRQVLLCL